MQVSCHTSRSDPKHRLLCTLTTFIPWLVVHFKERSYVCELSLIWLVCSRHSTIDYRYADGRFPGTPRGVIFPNKRVFPAVKQRGPKKLKRHISESTRFQEFIG